MKHKFLWFTIFYIANLFGVAALIFFVIDNTFVNILLAGYVLLLTGIFSYQLNKKQRR